MNISIHFTAHLANNKGCDSEYLKCYPGHCNRKMVKPTAVSVGQKAVTVHFSDTVDYPNRLFMKTSCVLGNMFFKAKQV
jgi:hypothetical protein